MRLSPPRTIRVVAAAATQPADDLRRSRGGAATQLTWAAAERRPNKPRPDGGLVVAQVALRNDLWKVCVEDTQLNRWSFNEFLLELHGIDGRPGSAATHAGIGRVDAVRILQPEYDLGFQHPLEEADRRRLAGHRAPGQPPLTIEIVPDAGHYWNLEYPLSYAQRVRDMALDVFASHPCCPPR